MRQLQKIETPEKSYGWITIRKGIAIGAAVGALLSTVILISCELLPPGETSGGLVCVIPWFATLIPTWAVYKLFGLDWNVGSVNEVPKHIFFSIVLVNALFGAFVGCILGWWFMCKKRNNAPN